MCTFACLEPTVKQWTWRDVLCISGCFVALKDFRKLRSSVFSSLELEPRGNRNRSKCLYSGQKHIWYMESFVLRTVGCEPQEVIITERQLYGSESFFAWNFYASVSLHTVCLMYKINWCINQIKSSMLPTFTFAHRNSIWIWRNSHFLISNKVWGISQVDFA